ncbi:hypothetical protein ACLB1G_06780 [Oxalobacteraceae bacterium A2-2]
MTMMAPAPLILFIGRSAQALDVLQRLAVCGYLTETACDGAAAVLAAMTSAPHAVVIETGWGNGEGWRTAQTLRAIPDLCDVPLLALDCSGGPGCGATGRLFDGWLPPTGDDQALRLAIDACLNQPPPPTLRSKPAGTRQPLRLARRRAA